MSEQIEFNIQKEWKKSFEGNPLQQLCRFTGAAIEFGRKIGEASAHAALKKAEADNARLREELCEVVKEVQPCDYGKPFAALRRLRGLAQEELLNDE